MNPDDVLQILHQWQHEAKGKNLPRNELDQAVAQLPDGLTWAISDDGNALLAISGARELFTIEVEDMTVSTTYRPMAGEKILVRLNPLPTERFSAGETVQIWRWEFQSIHAGGGRETLATITGRATIAAPYMGGLPTLSRSEEFARAFAAQAGWSVFETA